MGPDRRHVFVASFSAMEDQLSQWRGYSYGSSGVSLAFQLEAFRPPSSIGTLVCFAPCVYKPADKRALLGHALSHFVKEAQGYWDAVFAARGKYDWQSLRAKDPSSLGRIVNEIAGMPDFKDRLAVAAKKRAQICCEWRHCQKMSHSTRNKSGDWSFQ